MTRVGYATWIPISLALTLATAIPAQAQQTQSKQSITQSPNASVRMLEDQIYVQLAERAWVGADFKAAVDGGTAEGPTFGDSFGDVSTEELRVEKKLGSS